jgi:serine/threonine-protein kinase
VPRLGDQITASIRLVRELGSGGMGSVWVADHAALQTQVVVKFMHVQLTGDRDSVLRFSREAAAGANVKSPHVVQVLDHGIAPDGAPFIVMELLEGSDLAAHLERNGPMPLAEVDHVISQTCKALARAHERGIVHRDIKPQNIFLTNVGGGEPFVKVLDFGIAKASGLFHAA